MAKKKGLTTPIILLIVVGIVLLCCCPTLVLGVPAVFRMVDSVQWNAGEHNLNELSTEPSIADSAQDEPVEVEVVSQYEFDQENSLAFMSEITWDENFQPLYEWALMEGILKIENEVGGGAEVVYSDGSVLRGVVHGDVQILQLTSPFQMGTGYVLSRYEGTDENPVWILFNQDGSASIDENGISVFDENGSPIGHSPFSTRENGMQLVSLSPIAATRCTTGGWDEFVRCIESQGSKLALGSVCLVSLAAGKVACVVGGAFTLGGSCIIAIGGAIVACGIVPGVCLKPALQDDWPQASISMWADTGEKRWIPAGPAPGSESGTLGWIEATIWKAKLTVTDDREPAPRVEPPSDWITAASGECPRIRVEDCGGYIIEPFFCTPDPTAAEQNTWRATHPDEEPEISDPPLAEPTEDTTFLPIEISYAGRYTGIMSSVYGSGVVECSTNQDYWSDVIFTYRFNADDTVTLDRIVVDGEVQTEGAWKLDYVPGDNNSYVYSYYTDAGFWETTLYFSNTDLRIEKYHKSNDGSSGTCVITLQVVPTP